MKRILTLILALSLLLTAAAAAEGAIYLRQLPQYEYINVALLTEESYPEVCLSPYYAFRFFGSSPVDPTFLCFPGPAGASPESFDGQSASYLDVENDIQYSYVVDGSNSFEEFVNKADKDEWILLDGSDGAAAVIFPDNRRASAMIATKEFGKSSKLRINIVLDTLSTQMPEETRVTALTDAILAEVERVQGAMRYETRAPYWSAGMYAGAKLLSYDDFDYMLKLNFPTLTYSGTNGDTEADMILTSIDYSKTVKGLYSFDEGTSLEVSLEFSDYSYSAHKLEDNDEAAAELKASDGRTWIVWMNWVDDKAISGYASTLLSYGQNHDEQRYLTVEMSGAGSGIEWTSNEEFLEDVELFTFEEMSAADDPYVPVEKPASAEDIALDEETAPAEEGAPAEDELPSKDQSWTCPGCGQENTGNFCGECGTPRPDSGEWTCPGCGAQNSGKFCTECGAQKPE